MSGITGLFYLDNRPVDPVDLGKMTDILAHRGPDDANIWYNGPVGLGHRMLWTTPESLHEKLPLTNATGDFVITADARIDNRAELLPLLGLNDRPAADVTDSQIILTAYQKWGEQCPEKLLGDFAFVIWDEGKQQLFCARDYFGVKPFYYYHQPHHFFGVASEIKALRSLSELPPQRLNEVRVGDYLEAMFEDKSNTFYQDIFRLPPAHWMIISQIGIQIQLYWSLDPERSLLLDSNEAYAEAFREVFTESVRCRLRTAFPLGSMLSGGMDSSAVTCVARQLLVDKGHHNLPTFSVIYNTRSECDESPYINAVVAQGNINPHYIEGDKISPLVDLDRLLWHQDEPFFAPNWFLHWGIWQAAQQQGVRIVLDGYAGDSTISHGFGHLMELASLWRWLALRQEVQGLAKIDPRYSSPFQVFKYFIWQYSFKSWTPELILRAWRALRGRDQAPLAWNFNPTINSSFAQRIGLVERIRMFKGQQSKRVRSERMEHYKYLTTGEIPFALEIVDKAAMSFPIEPRYPFLDRRLAEFCLSLPPEQKLHQGWTRMIVRRGLDNILPQKVQWRADKANLSSNFDYGLLAFEKERLDTVIFDDAAMIEPYVDTAILRQLYQHYRKQTNMNHSLTIWSAVILALSLRRMGLIS